ncbi:phosphoglycerate dehydrogenase, partial [bacterium]|nr:phosphoglycerate dehydrogenase [bacterium]
MMKVLVSDPLSEEGLEILKKEKDIEVKVATKLSTDELKKRIKDADALIVRSGTNVTTELIQAGSSLKVIGRAGVGVDNVDVEAATEKGVIVMNSPGANTISTAEHTVALLLSLSRNIPQAYLSLKQKKWERKKFMGVEVFNKTLGIVGLGRIGGEVAKRALAFGMRVVGYDPYIRSEAAMRAGVELVEIRDLLSRSDYITVHVPLTDETRHLIGKKEFEVMKEGVRIINCARGGIIDESALYEAIKKGKVAGAAFDVFEREPPVDNPLLEFDSVVASPHLGASTEEAQVGVAVDIAGQIIDFLKKGIIRNAVNLPFVEPETFEELKPYCRLAEKLGSLESQLVEGRMKEVRIDCAGEDLVGNMATITAAVLKGVFEPVLKESVNYVNAPVIAKKRGVKVVESKSSQAEDYTSLIRVELETDKSQISAAGVLFGRNDARVVRINSYHVD